jgi:hypothetical protein
MAHHPRGTTVDIVGIEAPGNGRSCEEHDICGSVLMEDSVVRIRCVQVVVDGLEESALACFWITDGIDRCRVGFLPRHYVKHWEDFEGRLAQIVEFYKDSDSPEKRRKNYRNSGCCKAVLIDTLFGDDADDNIFSPVKWRKFNANTSEEEEHKGGQGEDLKKKGAQVKEEGEEKNNIESELGDDDDDDDIFTPESKKRDKRKAGDHEGHSIEEEERDVMEKEKKKKAKMTHEQGGEKSKKW